MKQISFIADGLTLRGSIFHPVHVAPLNPAILFVHGWTSEQERSFQYAKALTKLGYVCMLFDMRGHGMSDGNISTFTIKDFFTDVVAAYDYLSALPEVDGSNISAVGSSFGCYLLALLTEKRNIKNLVIRVPADYPNEVFSETKMQNSGSNNPLTVAWRNKERSFNDSYALKAIHEYHNDLLIIEAEKDTIVPHQTVQNYANAVANKKKLTHIVMKDAPHSIKEGKFRDEVEKILARWFKDKV